MNKSTDTTKRKRIIEAIKLIVCNYYEQDPIVFIQKSRKRELLHVVHSAIYFIDKNMRIGPTELSTVFGYDHATIIYIIRKTKNLLDIDKNMRLEYEEIQSTIVASDLQEKSAERYYIDLNNCVSMKNGNNRAVVFSGFNDDDLDNIVILDKRRIVAQTMYEGAILFEKSEKKQHQKTGVYLIEKAK